MLGKQHGSAIIMALFITGIVSLMVILLIQSTQQLTTQIHQHNRATHMLNMSSYAMPWVIDQLQHHPQGQKPTWHGLTMPKLRQHHTTIEATLYALGHTASLNRYCLPPGQQLLPIPPHVLKHHALVKIQITYQSQHRTLWRCLYHDRHGVTIERQHDTIVDA